MDYLLICLWHLFNFYNFYNFHFFYSRPFFIILVY